MKIERCKKEPFIVTGKERATTDGTGFIQKLWDEANSHFGEIQNLTQKDENGNTNGIWGAVFGFSRSFQPWEDFNKGLYLAGVECNDNAEAPDGWTEWIVPGCECIYVERESDGIFSGVTQYLADNDTTLVETAHEFICLQTEKGYMFFPIKKL